MFHSLKGTKEPPDLDQDQMSNGQAPERATSSLIDGVKGSVRFQELVQDHTVKNQSMSALHHIHSWSRIQDQIRARRLCMVTEARIKQKKLENQLKLEAKLHELEVLNVTNSFNFLTYYQLFSDTMLKIPIPRKA